MNLLLRGFRGGLFRPVSDLLRLFSSISSFIGCLFKSRSSALSSLLNGFHPLLCDTGRRIHAAQGYRLGRFQRILRKGVGDRQKIDPAIDCAEEERAIRLLIAVRLIDAGLSEPARALDLTPEQFSPVFQDLRGVVRVAVTG